MTALDISSRLAANLDRIRNRVESVCASGGRDPASVTLIAVTKYAPLDWVRALTSLGVAELGESRPQQLAERADVLGTGLHWHLIGPLQRNKVRRMLELGVLIHSIDSLRLLERIDRLAAELRVLPKLLLEVNVSGEAAKHGFSPDDLSAQWHAIAGYGNVRIAGLMTMAPYADNPEEARPAFRELRLLRDRLREQAPGFELPELSMGMSGDFEVAIEEGATLIRIGSSLFEGLDSTAT